MTKDEIFYKKQKDMPTNELLELAHKEISKMCKTGGRSFTMSIPVLVTDTDMILSEALNRLKALEQVKINVDLGNVIQRSELVCMCKVTTQVSRINDKYICCACNRPLM